jgi:hypothetical protein
VHSATLERRGDIDLGGLIRRREPEEERGANHHGERKEQHGGVERGRQGLPDREIAQEHVAAPACEQQAGQATRGRQQQALRQQLPDQSSARRTQPEADRDVPPA